MSIPITFILSILFINILSIYDINLDDVSLFGDSFFMFLVMLNDVLY